MKYEEYDVIKLKDGRVGTIVGIMKNTYVVDVGEDESDWETIDVWPDEIEAKEE